jgi:hypothetical protein
LSGLFNTSQKLSSLVNNTYGLFEWVGAACEMHIEVAAAATSSVLVDTVIIANVALEEQGGGTARE